jgi:hypothetical protein
LRKSGRACSTIWTSITYPVSVFHRKHTILSLYCQEFVALFHCCIKTASLVHVRLSMSSLVQISVSVSTRRIMGL